MALGGPSNLHLDIIMGRDTKIDIDDIYNGLNIAGSWLIGRSRFCECSIPYRDRETVADIVSLVYYSPKTEKQIQSLYLTFLYENVC